MYGIFDGLEALILTWNRWFGGDGFLSCAVLAWAMGCLLGSGPVDDSSSGYESDGNRC